MLYDNPSTKNFVGVMFTCCGVYGRVYKNKEGTAYVGRCPKCLKSIRMKIGKADAMPDSFMRVKVYFA